MSSPDPDRSSTEASASFPIRTVCALTGVNPITLRAWERRYGLVQPARSAGGQRRYSRADIDTVHRALALVEGGMAIGRARDLLASRTAPSAGEAPGWASQRSAMLAAIEQFDEARLDRVYGEMLALHSIERVMREVLMPLFAELGERWRSRRGGVAEEHFFAVYLRNKLGARFHHRGLAARGPTLLVACLPGEQHDTGALLFSLAAHERGHRIVLLGANVPLDECAYAARRVQASAVVLSGTATVDPAALGEPLQRLVAGAGAPVFVGGPTSVEERDRIVAAGAQPLGTDIPAALARIDKALPSSRASKRTPAKPAR